MDILIKGERIELPKNGECYIDIRIYETGEIVIDGDQDKTATAVSLPEHGRLIDGDKLLSIFRQANKDCYQIGKYERASQWYDAEGFVEMQKTIVEANNGTDN